MANNVKHDVRSNTGQNINFLRGQANLHPDEGPSKIKYALNLKHESECDPRDVWRIGYLQKLLTERGEKHYLGEQDEVDHLSTLINTICTT